MRGKHQPGDSQFIICIQTSSSRLRNRRRAVEREREREREEFAHIHTTDTTIQDDGQSHMTWSYGHKVLLSTLPMV